MLHRNRMPYIASLLTTAAIPIAIASPARLETQLGIVHIGGLYSFSDTDYLNEGAADAGKIGARCIKVALILDTVNPSPKLYALNSRWPSGKTLE